MNAWSGVRSIRTKLVLLVLAALLPMAGVLTWVLAVDLNEEREVAHAKVRLLAAGTSASLERFLRQSEQTLSRLAARPQVRAMDPQHCDPILQAYVQLYPEFSTFSVRNRQGDAVCAAHPEVMDRLNARQGAWVDEALQAPGFHAGDAFFGPRTGRWMTALSVPIRDDAGTPIGLLVLPVDLLVLSEQLLGATPKSAVISVYDRQRAIVLRSTDAGSFIGNRQHIEAPKTLPDQDDDLLPMVGLDGVRRLASVRAMAGVGWLVSAGLPETEVFAEYRALQQRLIVAGTVLLLLALGLAWRLGSAILQPIADLVDAARQVAAGHTAARAKVAGPAEIQAVAQQFNLMLDARDLSEAQLRGIFDSATDAIVTLDENQTIVMANNAAAAMFGRPLQTLIGAPHDILAPARFRSEHRRDIQAFGSVGNCTARLMGDGREVTGVRASGEEFPIDAAISQVTVAGRHLYTAIMRDITQQRHAERALRESETRMRNLLTMLPEAVLVNTDDHVGFVNEAAQQLFGGSPAQLLGCNPLELFMPESVEVVKARIAALRGGLPVAPLRELRVRRLDGTVRIVESTAVQIDDSSGRAILVVLRDVTRLRQALSALELTHADLQRLYAAQGEVQENERKRIARELHDDLQQTLGAIRMNVAVIGDGLATQPARVAPLVAQVDQLSSAAIESIRRIINDLRPQMLEDLGLAAALEALARQFSLRHGMHCEFVAQEHAGEATLHAPAVATSLYRLVQEALNNVAKHARASEVTIGLEDAGDGQLRLSIRDNGQGFDPAAPPHLGSFGLLGIHERVRALGGTLHIRSAPGQGTQIEVVVPLTEPSDGNLY